MFRKSFLSTVLILISFSVQAMNGIGMGVGYSKMHLGGQYGLNKDALAIGFHYVLPVGGNFYADAGYEMNFSNVMLFPNNSDEREYDTTTICQHPFLGFGYRFKAVENYFLLEAGAFYDFWDFAYPISTETIQVDGTDYYRNKYIHVTGNGLSPYIKVGFMKVPENLMISFKYALGFDDISPTMISVMIYYHFEKYLEPGITNINNDKEVRK